MSDFGISYHDVAQQRKAGRCMMHRFKHYNHVNLVRVVVSSCECVYDCTRDVLNFVIDWVTCIFNCALLAGYSTIRVRPNLNACHFSPQNDGVQHRASEAIYHRFPSNYRYCGDHALLILACATNTEVTDAGQSPLPKRAAQIIRRVKNRIFPFTDHILSRSAQHCSKPRCRRSVSAHRGDTVSA